MTNTTGLLRRIAALTILVATPALAEASGQHTLELSTGIDDASGQTAGVGYSFDASRWGVALFASQGEFDQTGLALDGSTFDDVSRSTDLSASAYWLIDSARGTWELAAGGSQSDIDDGSETRRFFARLGYQADRWQLSATGSLLDVRSVIAIEQSLFRFSRVVQRDADRDGTGVALDGSVALTEHWQWFAGARSQSFDDLPDFNSSIRLVTNTPLNEAQRVSAWTAYTGVGWYGDRWDLSVQLSTDEAEDFNDRSETLLLDLGAPLNETLYASVVLGTTRSEVFDSTSFAELVLRASF
ncbi:MAG: hypothetical protein AAF648_17625 [Pseudomonadota bacterium]